jgi:vitamin B12 transporter
VGISQSFAQVEKLEEISILDSNNEAGVSTEDSPFALANKEVITFSKESHSSFSNLASALKQVSGVQIEEIGGEGSRSTLTLRGVHSQQVSIFINGMSLNSLDSGGVDLSLIPIESVERVEIYKSSVPLHLSSSNLGGAINIILKQKAPNSHDVEIGEHGLLKSNLNYYLKKKNVDYLLGLSFLENKNEFNFLNDQSTDYDTSDDSEEKREHASISYQAFFMNIKKKKYLYTFTLLNKSEDIPDWQNSKGLSTELDTSFATGQFKYIARQDDQIHQCFKLGVMSKEERYSDPLSEVGLSAQNNRYHAYTISPELSTEIFSGSDSIGTLAKIDIENVSHKNMDGNTKDKLKREKLDLSLEWNHFFSDDTIQSSLQYQTQFVDSEGTTDKYHSGGAILSFEKLLKHKVSFHFNNYIRIPKLAELYGDRGTVTGNSSLTEERGVGLNLHFAKTLGRLSYEAEFFYKKIEDIIVTIFDAQGVGKALNLDSALISGIDLRGAYKVNEKLRIKSSYNLQRALNKSDASAYHDKLLPGKFEYQYNLGIDYHVSKVSMSLEYSIFKNKFYDSANLLAAKDIESLNYRLNYNLSKKKSLSLNIKNVLDNQYEDFNGYPKPGRLILLGYRERF